MKTHIQFFLLFISTVTFAQAPPQGINYQAVLYDIEGSQMPGVDAENLVLANQDIRVRFTILKDTYNGTEVYSEDHQTTTDSYGLFTLVIGQGNQLSAGDFVSINWGSGYHFLKVDIDRNGGSDFNTISNTQFWSVPYALYAGKSGNGIDNVTDNGDGTLTFTYADSSFVTVGPIAWALTGNSGTDPSNQYLGTNDAKDMVIKTNSQERMRITSNGRIGVNTSNPANSALLELNSNTKGLRLTRLTAMERDAISDPVTGLIIYNTTDNSVEYFNGVCWIPTYLTSCDDCLFDLTLPVDNGVIDRVTADSILITINVSQTANPPQTISFFVMENLPDLTTTDFSQDTLTGSGSVTLEVTTSIFDEPGLYPIAIQAVCGNNIQVEVFYLTIDSCYQVIVNSSVSQYNLKTFNSLPGVGTPICVVLDVPSTGQFSSTSSSIASYTSGALDPQSHVGIRNYGSFFGRGGNGGTGGSLGTFGEAGQNGGTSLNMTCKTTVLNYGYIFGGGGGGASVGLSQTINIPIVGNWTLAIGAGGGGGCEFGAGGGTGGSTIGYWNNGQSATGGLSAIPGQGGEIDLPINIPLGPVTLTINPDVQGGDGGNYGQAGSSGQLTINASATIPIIGTINIPLPSVGTFPAGGNFGYAVRKNGNELIGIPNGNYQLNNLKGIVND